MNRVGLLGGNGIVEIERRRFRSGEDVGQALGLLEPLS